MRPCRACIVLLAAFVMTCGLSAPVSGAASSGVAGNVVLWDTGSPFGDTVDMGNRAAWKAVPPDLIQLEADPLKSSSDPGYYGRPYEFQGDAVVENHSVIAVVWSAKGTVAVFSKSDPGRQVMELVPLQMKAQPRPLRRCTIVQNTGDEVAVEISYADAGTRDDLSAVLAFDKTPIVEIRPAPGMKGISVLSSIEYGIAPSFVGDDLVLGANQYPSAETLCVPADNLFVGLLQGANSVLVMTWPQGKQRIGLGRTEAGQEGRPFESIDFDNDGQAVYLALLEAPGIWHREKLGFPYLEKEVKSQWKKPFPAKWVTQLWEGDVRTTYTFRKAPPGTVWRGVAGMYSYPIWFDGDTAFYHLTKKVLPKGESIVYFLEGQNTPASIWTPVDILKDTLGRPACESILDIAGRKPRTHHRRGAIGIRRACTCGCTEAIEAVFKAGQEVERKDYIEGAVGDMVYFVARHLERLHEYRAFANDMTKFLRTTAASRPELNSYIDSLVQIVQQIPDDYAIQKENLKSLEYADELSGKTIALTRRKDPQNLSTCLELCKNWRGMGGAQDGLLAEYHIIVRKLFQEAGYGCVNQPQAVDLAREVRSRCRQCLRNADGYEIWPNY